MIHGKHQHSTVSDIHAGNHRDSHRDSDYVLRERGAERDALSYAGWFTFDPAWQDREAKLIY
jgi:hypothetical protein